MKNNEPTITCARCGRTEINDIRTANWNVLTDETAGVVRRLEACCPACQTPEEDAEARDNFHRTVFSRDAFGRVLASQSPGPEARG